jgi:gluconolactonase
MKVWRLLLCALSLQFSSSLAHTAGDSSVLRLNPSVDALVAGDASLETLAERDTTFEGPTWVPEGGSGYLIFADVPGNVIDRLNSDGSVSPFLENIFAGKDASEAYESFGLDGQKKFRMLGANGVTLDLQGRVVYCAYSDGQIVRLERDGRRTVLASHFAGHRINAPNDLVYGLDGALYFTDSRAGTRHADGDGVPHKGLYVLRKGEVRLLSKDIDHPNGVALSPDQTILYVTNTLQKNILRFDIQAGGVANEQIFADMSGDEAVGAPDGIKVDAHGNIYATGPGGVWILSPCGEHIGTIVTPKKITNMVFGGKDYSTLYMTGSGTLYRISLRSPAR